MKGSTAIAKVLKAEGVDTVFCFPNNPLIEAVVLKYSYPKRTRFWKTEPISCSIYGEMNGRQRELTSDFAATCEFKLFCAAGARIGSPLA